MVFNTQPGGAAARWRQWSVGSTDVSSAADTEGRAVHAGSALSTRRHAAHDGQRRHLLRTTRSLHLHLQVSAQLLYATSTKRNDKLPVL